MREPRTNHRAAQGPTPAETAQTRDEPDLRRPGLLIRVLAALPGMVMLANAVGFLVAPARAVAGLGMPLLDGTARSTQLGDFTAFFLATAGFIFYGAARAQARWLFAAAWLLALAAAGRVFAFAVHGAAFAGTFIAVEAILAAWLAVVGYLVRRAA